jgi:outer membrane protein insertion porin family
MPPFRILWAAAGALAGVLLAGSRAEGVLPSAPSAQDPPPWEGKEISGVNAAGQVREHKSHIENLSGLRRGQRITRAAVDRAYKALWETQRFESVDIRILPDPADPAAKVLVTIFVREYPLVEAVEFRGLTVLPVNQVRPNLRVGAGDPLNPAYLQQDRAYIREQYLQKGYHFSSVEDSTRPGPGGGVILTWTILEGPLVSVDEIRFTGVTVDESELRRFMLTKESGRLLGLLPTGKEPFVERHLREDIERIKLYYRLEGWLDIHHGERVFVQDLVFSDDKTRVSITIHVDEGPRYRIRDVRIEFDPAARRVFSEEEIKSWLLSKPGEPYTERNAERDVARIRERYGERAYILAEINSTPLVSKDAPELDLVFSIKENEKIFVGRLIIEGNTKTREDVIRREFTRTGFVPGEEFNSRNLTLAARRLQDRGWVEPGGVATRTQEGETPQERDVIVDIREGQTGTLRFAAGYSSSFGILGILEFTQRNFDLSDLPTSFEDLFAGTGFAGGGQFLRIRLAPAARRQTYTVDFKEPYVFGYDFGMGVRGYATNTLRESYDDRRLGAQLVFDKRYDPLALQLALNGYRVDVDNIEPGAPLAVRELGGENTVFSITPALIWDTRDSFVFPTEGLRARVSWEYAGQILPGDFDFNKFLFETEGHVTLFETESRLKHVGSFQFTFGWVHGARGQESVPLIERFYAGGRDSIRGFDFRGMGPHEAGDPVGGEAYVLFTLEYSYPLFVEFLRGAFFWDLANLTSEIEGLAHDRWRNTVGFGIRFLIPQLGNVPVKLDFGFPLTREDEDERQTVTFDIGALF